MNLPQAIDILKNIQVDTEDDETAQVLLEVINFLRDLDKERG